MSDPKRTPYEVGYAKPPRATQFQKGQSGNPHGRRAAPKRVNAKVTSALDSYMVALEGGERVTITKRRAIVRRLVKRAFKANARATAAALQQARANEPEEPDRVTTIITDSSEDQTQSEPSPSNSEAMPTSEPQTTLRAKDK